MSLDHVPGFVREHYEVKEWNHASAILTCDFPEQWADIMEILSQFRLSRSHMLAPGGGKSPILTLLEQGHPTLFGLDALSGHSVRHPDQGLPSPLISRGSKWW